MKVERRRLADQQRIPLCRCNLNLETGLRECLLE
jgi:hypothetical protein